MTPMISRSMRLTLLIAIVLLPILLSCGKEPPPVDKIDPPDVVSVTDVDFCELVNSPDKFVNRRVRVRAIFCDCFENARLFSSRCPEAKKVWADGDSKPCSAQARIDKTRREASGNPGEQTYGAWNFGIVAVGRLIGTQGGFGHMGGFDLNFRIDCLDHSELLDKTGSLPEPGTSELKRIVAFETEGAK